MVLAESDRRGADQRRLRPEAARLDGYIGEGLQLGRSARTSLASSARLPIEHQKRRGSGWRRLRSRRCRARGAAPCCRSPRPPPPRPTRAGGDLRHLEPRADAERPVGAAVAADDVRGTFAADPRPTALCFLAVCQNAGQDRRAPVAATHLRETRGGRTAAHPRPPVIGARHFIVAKRQMPDDAVDAVRPPAGGRAGRLAPSAGCGGLHGSSLSPIPSPPGPGRC